MKIGDKVRLRESGREGVIINATVNSACMYSLFDNSTMWYLKTDLQAIRKPKNINKGDADDISQTPKTPTATIAH